MADSHEYKTINKSQKDENTNNNRSLATLIQSLLTRNHRNTVRLEVQDLVVRSLQEVRDLVVNSVTEFTKCLEV